MDYDLFFVKSPAVSFFFLRQVQDHSHDYDWEEVTVKLQTDWSFHVNLYSHPKATNTVVPQETFVM